MRISSLTRIRSTAQRSILIVLPAGAAIAEHRAGELAATLRSCGHQVTVLIARKAALQALSAFDCVITLSPSDSAHLVGYILHRRGTPWIADLDLREGSGRPGERSHSQRWSSLKRRLVVEADILTCHNDHVRQMIYERLGASAAVVADRTNRAIDRQVEALLTCRRPSTALRILMIGPVNSPHMEHLALSMRARGHIVQAGGAVWGGGLPPSSLPDEGIPVSVMTWPYLLWLRRLVRVFRPHVVHANWMPFAAAAVLAGARPLVAMAWGSDVYLAGRRQEILNRLVVRRANLALADSSALLERLIELGAPRERVALVNWGVDPDAFKPPGSPEEKHALRASLGLDDGPVILSPRGFKALYNPHIVIEAFARLARDVPDAQLVLKHQDEDEPALGQLAQSDRVHIVRHVPYERMADYYRAADVCLSIPDTDSSPRSVWEAMACGCPCVLSDLPWVHELIEPETHALVVPVDADMVSGAIKRLLTERELHRYIAGSARELVEKHRHAAREMDRLEALYVRLACRSAGGIPNATAASSTRARSPVSWRRE
jgi:glycosyltransferase involved in cell wall biosynthesis